VTAWILLTLAIAAEVAGTTALRASDGLTRPLPDAAVLVGYVLSFALLSFTLRHLALGTTYAIWAGAGTVAIALIGRVVFGDVLPPVTVLGMCVVVAGVVLIHLGGGVHR
jgi:small multidrug resistance pump